MKICSVCKEEKCEEHFYSYKDSRTKKIYFRGSCKQCDIDRSKDRVKDKSLEWFSDQKLRSNYGINFEQYNEMFANQRGCCYICNTHQSNFKRRLAVDHCHTSGKVRALLCTNCNTGLGKFLDSVELLSSAVDYINKHKLNKEQDNYA